MKGGSMTTRSAAAAHARARRRHTASIAVAQRVAHDDLPVVYSGIQRCTVVCSGIPVPVYIAHDLPVLEQKHGIPPAVASEACLPGEAYTQHHLRPPNLERTAIRFMATAWNFLF
eukprot:2141397-Pyramimonas_sp.AAC.1